MQQVSVAVPISGFSAQLDVGALDPATVVAQLSKTLTGNDSFAIYGTLDPSATGASPNLAFLAEIQGDNGTTRLATQIRGWRYLFAKRLFGQDPGNFIASGNVAQNPSAPSLPVALPAVGGFAQISFATFAGPVRVSLDQGQTANDTFDVYGTNDPAANSAAGSVFLGKMRGGGSSEPVISPNNSVVVAGYAFALVERTGGSTTGSASAWSAGTATGGGAGSKPSKANKGMSAVTTATLPLNPFPDPPILACLTGVTDPPVGWVGVAVNGVLYEPGDGTTNAPCYFSNDGGTTPKAQGSIQVGDLLYWNNTVAGFSLNGPPGPVPPIDIIDFLYNT